MDSGQALKLINGHEPKPLFYEMQTEVEDFDADAYEVEQRGNHIYINMLRPSYTAANRL